MVCRLIINLEISKSLSLVSVLHRTVVVDRLLPLASTEVVSGEFERAALLSNEVQRRYQ